jgi:hypothetical protein
MNDETATPLPTSARAAWERAFVVFCCDEINGVFDRIAEAVVRGDPCPPGLKTRLRPILQALAWDRDAAVREAWAIGKGELDRRQDAFAPAMILTVLAPEDRDVTGWAATLPAEVARALEAARQ